MEVQIQGNKINCPLKDKWLIATPKNLFDKDIFAA